GQFGEQLPAISSGQPDTSSVASENSQTSGSGAMPNFNFSLYADLHWAEKHSEQNAPDLTAAFVEKVRSDILGYSKGQYELKNLFEKLEGSATGAATGVAKDAAVRSAKSFAGDNPYIASGIAAGAGALV